MELVYMGQTKTRHCAEKDRKPPDLPCLSLQVLLPLLGAERFVLQRDGLLRPGEYAQVSVNAFPLFFVQGIHKQSAKPVGCDKYPDK